METRGESVYKLICIDLDGTLLDSHGRVSSKNRLAIRKALDANLDVAVVSGRPNCFTIRIMNQISGRMGHITFNGAYYRVDNKTKQFPIDHQTVLKIAQLAKQHNVRTFFKNKNLSLCSKSDVGILDYDQFRDQTPIKDRMDMYYDVDIEARLQTQVEPILKIFVWDEDANQIERLYHDIKELDHITIFRYDDFFEISSNKTSKGKAIVDVCSELNIPLSEVACIGDNFNDLPMFEVVGLSIAMGNAPLAIKEKANRITLTNNQSGVAYAIEHFIMEDK